ncbi:MAG: histidine phosphatase family protein [Thermoanaerobaculia bacterium]
MSRRVLLIRHPAVADEIRGVCYGTSDVPLSPEGAAQIAGIVESVSAHGPVTHVYHSGLRRTALVAEALTVRTGIGAAADPRLRERCFGEWEMRPWDDIHAETGEAMMGMVRAPGRWHPPGGETTFELRDRVLAWYAELPPEGCIVAVTHGGPIAVLRGTLAGLPVERWPLLVPAYGESVTL